MDADSSKDQRESVSIRVRFRFAPRLFAGGYVTERILLVDDDPEVVRLFGYALKRADYEVMEALNGEVALRQAHQTPPDLIVLDVMMPGLDGYEVARRLRARPETAAVPIVILTARALVPDHVGGMQAGATAYLVKPVMPSVLLQTLREILATHRASVVSGQ